MSTITIPETAAELEELLADVPRISQIVSEGRLPEVVRAYAATQAKKNPDIGDQVRREVAIAAQEFFAEHGVHPPGAPTMPIDPTQPVGFGAGKGARHNPKAAGAPLDKMFGGDHAEFLRAISHTRKHEPATLDMQRQMVEAVNAYTSGVPSEGGFLIPETMRSQMLATALESAIVRPRATVIPMETLRVPMLAIDTTSHADSVYGGIIGYWTEESGELITSEAKFRRLVLEAHKLTAYTEVPNELMNDSIISLEAFIAQRYPQALSWFEDTAFVRGNGVGQPTGFLDCSAAVNVTKESGQADDTIVWENIVKMYSRMLPASLGSAVWLANINTFPQLATMLLADANGAGGPVWIGHPQHSGASGPPMSILGRPVIFTEKMNTLGDQGDLVFTDLSYYLVGDRQMMQAMSSEHFRFSTDRTAFRMIQRVDGRPWIASPITPQNSSTTLTPFVQLGERDGA